MGGVELRHLAAVQPAISQAEAKDTARAEAHAADVRLESLSPADLRDRAAAWLRRQELLLTVPSGLVEQMQRRHGLHVRVRR